MRSLRIGGLFLGIGLIGLLMLSRFGADPAPIVAETADSERSTGVVPAPGRGVMPEPAYAETAPVSSQSEDFAPAADETGGFMDSPSAGSSASIAVPSTPLPSAAPAETAAREPGIDIRRQLDEMVAAEPEDPAWALAMESQIFSEISLLPGLAATLIDVDCRTTHCVVRVSLPPEPLPGQPELTAMSADGHPVFVGAAALDLETVALLNLIDPDGLPVFVAYLRREADAATQSRPLAASTA